MTIIGLVAVAAVLAVIFIYLQTGETTHPPVIDQRVSAIHASLAKLAEIVPASQTSIEASLKQLSLMNSARASQSEINQSLSQLKAK